MDSLMTWIVRVGMVVALACGCSTKDPLTVADGAQDATGRTTQGDVVVSDGDTDAADGATGTDAVDGATDATDGATDATDGATDATDGVDGATDGVDGAVDATDGADGQAGADGTDGQTGTDGASGEDTTPPEVVSAFSADGVTVTVRFSEPVDTADAGAVGNYQIKGSDNSTVAIASVSVNGRFATLTLQNSNDINPNLTYQCLVQNVTDLAGNGLDTSKNKSLIRRTVYLNIIWHQHQPLYYEAAKDELAGPWVRKHATKDYYDMASVLLPYPNVHLNINLTIVLLSQLEIYNERLLPFVDKENNTVDEEAFLAQWKGKTDPFIDLLLEDTPTPEEATEKQIGLFYDDPWATVSTNDATMKRWPEYVELREKNPKLLTQEDFLKLKIFFELAWFDPDFIQGPVALPTGATVDLSDLVTAHADGTYTLAVPASEQLANRLVAENAKIIEATIPIHKQMMYNWQTKEGQIEITTTPFYHPILPLIYNTDLASAAQPFDPLPSPAFSFELDAEAQVLKAVAEYQNIFGIPPAGMWCGEGSVAEEIVGALQKAGIRWTATDRQVLYNSQPSGQQHWYPYRLDVDTVPGDGGSHDDEMVIVFRDTQMSNDIGFKYQSYWGQDAANEILANTLAQAPPFGAKDRIITLIIDGENAWEEYSKEHDGKGFFHALYGSLSEAYEVGEIVTVTMAEYIDGNPARAVPPHPIAEQTELEPLWPGSWIDGTYAVWIGESEENAGWEYLLQARNDLAKSNLPRPNPLAPAPADEDSKAYKIWAAWEAIYAAEGSDWFWWYGADMTTPANDDTPFDQGFRGHLSSMYQFMNEALAFDGKPPFAVPDFKPIIQAQPQPPSDPFTEQSAPTLDGLLSPNELEWTELGGFYYDNDSGAQANQDDDIALVYYGYSAEGLYLGILSNDDLSAKSDYDLFVYLSHKKVLDLENGVVLVDPANETTRFGSPLAIDGGAAREVRLALSGGNVTTTLSTADGSGGWTSAAHSIVVGGPVSPGKLVEVMIPWNDLNQSSTDPLAIQVVASGGGADIDLAPSLEPKVVFDDSTNLVYVTFECDATGSVVPYNSFTDIATPPPPTGNGIVYITGNHDKLLQWTPNKVAMLDDGVAPDKVANDGIWTLTVGLPPGTLLRYKYTIGLPQDEGKWSGTEEFPLTERGLDVTKDPTKSKMNVKDVFANRPQPSGTVASMTVIDILE